MLALLWFGGAPNSPSAGFSQRTPSELRAYSSPVCGPAVDVWGGPLQPLCGHMPALLPRPQTTLEV